jgi:hypothetical protein
MLRSRTPSSGRAHGLRVTLPRSLPTLPTTQSMASRLTGRLSSSCTVIGTCSHPAVVPLGGIGLIGLVVHGAFGTPPFARQTLTGRARWQVKTVAGLTAAAF